MTENVQKQLKNKCDFPHLQAVSHMPGSKKTRNDGKMTTKLPKNCQKMTKTPGKLRFSTTSGSATNTGLKRKEN
jgi:hypothetical protein